MKAKHFLFSLWGMLLFFACQPVSEVVEPDPPVEAEEPATVENPVITKAVFSGYAQKGPFINGSSVLISELDSALNQTGRVYSTRIISNTGAFEQKNIELISPYMELRADGYYFNEVLGKTSPGQITLYALVDVSDVNSANINVLTHLSKPRIEYLVQEEHLPFAEAKVQAEKEILTIFDLETAESEAFETFDLTHNALLIAVASILQGYSQPGDVMQLMADIMNDIRTGGLLIDPDLGSRLASNANALNLQKVRENLEKKYTELRIETDIPDFESVIHQFLEKTTYKIGSLVKYPEYGNFPNYGPNVLAENNTEFITGGANPNSIKIYYPVTVEVPEGMAFRIVVTSPWILGDWPFYIYPSPDTWVISTVIFNDGIYNKPLSREIKLRESGKVAEVGIAFDGVQEYIFECYENDSTEPTYVKKIIPSANR